MTHVRTSRADGADRAKGSLDLTARQRQMLALMVAEGLTVGEAGAKLGLPQATAQKIVQTVLAQLGSPVQPADRSRKTAVTRETPAGAVSTRDVRGMYGLSQEGFARLVGVTGRTIARWEVGPGFGPIRRDHTVEDRLRRLDEMGRLGVDTLGSQGFQSFVQSRQPLLGGDRVLDLLHTGRVSDVFGLLVGMSEGGPA